MVVPLLYAAVTFMPDVLNVSPATYESLLGFVVTVMPVKFASETVMLNVAVLPLYVTVTVFVPDVLMSG